MSSARDLLGQLKFCVFDLETTGGNHKNDKIIEIGLVVIENLEIKAQKNYLIQPEIKIPEFIQKLTTITPQDVKTAPIIEDVIDEILETMGDSILVAHNTSFDVPFFNSVLRRLGRAELPNKSLCTNLMTKYLIPNLMNTNLNYMSKIFHIHHDKAHRALDDALATAGLLLNYLNIFIDKDIQKINHLYYPRNRYELDRINFRRETPKAEIEKKLKRLKSSSIVTFKGDQGVILYALPCLPLSESPKLLSLVLEKMEALDWELMTIRIMGPLIEALVHFAPLFHKLDTVFKHEIIDHLWDAHLPGERPKDPTSDQQLEALSQELGDFFIAHHLVPEQLVLYPLLSLEPRSSLVFRYPGHEKKLVQSINSKAHRIESNKLKPAQLHTLLKEFMISYLLHEKKRDQLFFFDKVTPKKQSVVFFEKLDAFLEKNPNPYSYPRDYV